MKKVWGDDFVRQWRRKWVDLEEYRYEQKRETERVSGSEKL